MARIIALALLCACFLPSGVTIRLQREKMRKIKSSKRHGERKVETNSSKTRCHHFFTGYYYPCPVGFQVKKEDAEASNTEAVSTCCSFDDNFGQSLDLSAVKAWQQYAVLPRFQQTVMAKCGDFIMYTMPTMPSNWVRILKVGTQDQWRAMKNTRDRPPQGKERHISNIGLSHGDDLDSNYQKWVQLYCNFPGLHRNEDVPIEVKLAIDQPPPTSFNRIDYDQYLRAPALYIYCLNPAGNYTGEMKTLDDPAHCQEQTYNTTRMHHLKKNGCLQTCYEDADGGPFYGASCGAGTGAPSQSETPHCSCLKASAMEQASYMSYTRETGTRWQYSNYKDPETWCMKVAQARCGQGKIAICARSILE